MEKVILIKYGELSTKKDNINFFLNKLKVNILESLKGIEAKIDYDLGRMFSYSKNISALDLSSFNTSKLTKIAQMFSNCQSLTEIKFSSKFNTSNVAAFSYLFSECENLLSLDLSNFNTNNAVSMNYMFSNCLSLKELDLTSFNTTTVTNMSYMFNRNTSLNLIKFGNNFN